MKSNCIYFFTQCYNSEKTIARAIESILNQSYPNLIYYIVDNASTDRTKDIIKSYANLDNRIRSVFRDNNEYWNIYFVLPQILQECSDGFFAQLDADDEYSPLFAETLCLFMKEENLDIASCLSKFLNPESKDISTEHLKQKILIEHADYQIKFPTYFKFFRDSWGKIFSLNTLKDIEYKTFDPRILTGSVSYIAFEAVLRSNRIGIFPQQLHNYYIFPDSFERNPKGYNRILTPVLFQYYEDFLMKKCGFISEENTKFLCNTFCKAILTKMSRIEFYQLSTSVAMQIINDIFSCEFMQNSFAYADIDQICTMRNLYLVWMESLKDRELGAAEYQFLDDIRSQLDSAVYKQ